MSLGKNPFLRYRIIHSCLSNRQKRYWTKLELIKKLAEHDLQVSMRSLVSDLNMMRINRTLGYFAPIQYDRREKGYWYTIPNFSLDTLPLTQEDMQALIAATNILQQYKSVKFVQQFEGVVDKLSKVVNHLQNPEYQKIIAFENSPYYKGHDYVDQMFHAAVNKQPLCITYRKFDGHTDDEHILHPYSVKEYKGRWYVLGYSEARKYVITLGLDRMEKVEPSSKTFKENKILDPEEYFRYTLGITRGKGPTEDIELWFSPTQAPYIKTQHIHHTQKTICEDDNGLVISLKLIPNPELQQLLLSYGADVRIVKPIELAEKMKVIYLKTIANINK